MFFTACLPLQPHSRKISLRKVLGIKDLGFANHAVVLAKEIQASKDGKTEPHPCPFDSSQGESSDFSLWSRCTEMDRKCNQVSLPPPGVCSGTEPGDNKEGTCAFLQPWRRTDRTPATATAVNPSKWGLPTWLHGLWRAARM